MKRSLALLGLIALTSCGGNNTGNNQQTPHQEEREINTVVAEDVLTEAEALNNLEAWKQKPIKACSLKDAIDFPEAMEDRKGLDIQQIVLQNKRSAIFTHKSESVAIAGYESNWGDIFKSSTNETVTFKAQAVRTGNSCEVFFNGIVVFKTILATSITINNHWGHNPTLEATSFPERILESLRTSDASKVVLQHRLNLTDDEVRSFVKVSKNEYPFIFKSSAHESWDVFAPEIDQTLEIRLMAPKIYGAKGETLNTSDIGNMTFEFNFNSAGRELLFNRYVGITKYNLTEAKLCFETYSVRLSDEEVLKKCSYLYPALNPKIE